MSTTPLSPFETLQQQAIEELGAQTLANNPNIKKSDRIPSRFLEVLTFSSPEIRQAALTNGYTQEQINNYQKGAQQIEEQYLSPYNLTPLDFNEREDFPIYTSKRDNMLTRSRGNVAPYEPGIPYGYDEYKEIKSYGIDPSNQFKFEKFLDNVSYRKKLAHSPRNLTQKDIKYITDQFDIEGDVRFINPKKPELGLMIKQAGREDWQVFDSPTLTDEDTLDFILQEMPSLVGDILLTNVATKGAVLFGKKVFPALEPLLSGKTPGPFKRGTEVLTIAGMAAAGATGGELIRLMVGASSAVNAHDRDITEMMKEAGFIGALSFAGTAAISTAMKTIPVIYQKIFGKSVPPSFYNELDQIYKQAEKTEAGGKLLPDSLYGNEITIKEIRNSISSLAARTKNELTEYNPTLASKTGLPNAKDLEFVFLKNADDPELSKLYTQIKQGNQKVIDDFLDALGREFGGEDLSGQTIAKGINTLVRQDIQMIQDEALQAIDTMRKQAGTGRDVSVTGEVLLKEVNRRGTNKLMPKTQLRLDQMKSDYIQNANDVVNAAVNNPLYADTLTGAQALKKPSKQWANATKKQANELFTSVESGEASDLFYQLLGTDGGALLNRLQNKGTIKKLVVDKRNPTTVDSSGEKIPNMVEISTEGAPKSADLNIQELNNMRKRLNEFASLADNTEAKGFARDLERGLEKQMQTLLKEAAAAKTGYKGPELKTWMRDNNWGDDIMLGGIAQREAYRVANSNFILGILEKQPEQVTDYILGTGTAGSKTNTRVINLMKVLKDRGRPSELQKIKKGFQAHIQKEIFDNPDLNDLQKTRAYRNFIREHQGTLKPIFGNDFLKFPTKKGFEKQIAKLENYDQQVKILEARFGTYAEDNPAYGNIVEMVLQAPTNAKASGRAFFDQEYLLDVIRRDDTLAEQTSFVTRNFILSNVQRRVPGYGGKSMIDPNAFNDFLTKGFDEKGLYNYDNYIEPMLGRLDDAALKKANPAQLKLHKEAVQFNSDLKSLNEMIQLESEAALAPSSKVLAGTIGADVAPKYTIWIKYFVKPLTQLGRRLNAMQRQQGTRAATFLGKLMLEPEVFKIAMNAMRRNLALDKTATVITAWGISTGRTEYANEIADELKYYNKKEMKQGSKKEITPINTNTRILEIFNETGGSNLGAVN
tara:strand:+ start:1509 stop:4991 length:3483 start_codon:yes stop_codon:yes gene_type:complete